MRKHMNDSGMSSSKTSFFLNDRVGGVVDIATWSLNYPIRWVLNHSKPTKSVWLVIGTLPLLCLVIYKRLGSR